MVCELKQLLVVNDPEVIFLRETKVHTKKFISIHSKCRMDGCLAVNAIGKSGGLVMMWKEGTKNGDVDAMEKIEKAKINRIIDSLGSTYTGNRLKAIKLKLGKLLDNEEKYWAQCLRVNWLKKGDRNTRFFHVRATNRKIKNNIERLKDMHGHWKENTKDICEAAREYFQNLFESNLQNFEVLNLDYIENCILGEMNERLMNEFTDNEITEAFNQMDPEKAPGIDGLSGNFYKEN
ncbi:uncharacterized protein LOC128033889 [Gossypium raimondii]|uniref:uncharacterized protein LOC128033889 n=1 Tax=Gossypium raimondii TaxID=29730 RepID=UPI00227A0DBB|nr:uncharacterized protein LOC128033889 [Gossypium raimondii]